MDDHFKLERNIIMIGRFALLLAILLPVAGTAFADNNIVTTLPVTAKGTESSFVLPRDGWVRLSGLTQDTVKLQADGREQIVKTRNGAAFARLAAGTYTVDAAGIQARRVGENMYCSMDGKFGTDEMVYIPDNNQYSGRSGMFLYNWNYLRKNILDPFPLLLHNSSYNDDVRNWQAEGRRVIRRSTLLDTAEKTLALWNQRASEPGLNGIIPDEFVIPSGRKSATDAALGYANRGIGFQPDVLEAIPEWSKNHPGQVFYAWLGVPWNAENADLAPLHKALSAVGGMIAWESYTFGRSFENELSDRYLRRAAGFKKFDGDMRRFIVCPATFEYADNNVNIDFKVWLDQQLNLVATHPDFKGTGGIGMWIAYYTDPEILQWYSKLVKHYGIDGEKTMLSDQYGFKLKPGLLKDAEWQTLDNWNPSGSLKLVAKADSGLPNSPYFPRSSVNFLQMKRTAGGRNSVAQTLDQLEPGKLYSVEILMTNPAVEDKTTYDIEVALENAEVISDVLRWMPDFISRKPVYNARKIVFRAGDKPVKLVLRETATTTPGVPDTVLIDAVRVTPYFAQEKTNE